MPRYKIDLLSAQETVLAHSAELDLPALELAERIDLLREAVRKFRDVWVGILDMPASVSIVGSACLFCEGQEILRLSVPTQLIL